MLEEEIYFVFSTNGLLIELQQIRIVVATMSIVTKTIWIATTTSLKLSP